jgi:hypothetical protein
MLLFGARLLLGGANQLKLFIPDLLPQILVLCMQPLILPFEAD